MACVEMPGMVVLMRGSWSGGGMVQRQGGGLIRDGGLVQGEGADADLYHSILTLFQ